VVSNSKEDLLAQLQSLKVAKAENTDDRKICFVFTGQGAQYFAMGRELLKENPLFLRTMKQCEAIISKHMPWSLLEELNKSETESIISRPDISQPACAALQISLVKVWESYGVKPTVVVGHSSGEIAAAYCAGILSLEGKLLYSEESL
jgi:myxalamid-type polyketide synthase MxaE and MxaD